MTGTKYHNPVLLMAAVDGLGIKEDGSYVDVTFGGGGHSREILKRLGNKGRLLAFDQDEEAIPNAPEDSRFTLINENFRYIRQYLKFYGIQKVDGILADFGVSSHQFNAAARGFSTRFDAELDMRMSRRNALSAAGVVNTYGYEELRGILARYGELRNASAMARTLVDRRGKEPIKTTSALKKVLEKYLPRAREQKILARIFQALRIEVNQEIAAIEELLMQCPELLEPGGRLSMISYHSLEDRLVKRFMRTGKFEGESERDFYGNPQRPFKPVGRMQTPTEEEIAANSRARSARLRIAERL